MSERVYRFIVVFVYAAVAIAVNDAAMDFPHILAYVLGCGGIYVAAVNLPIFIETKRADIMELLKVHV